MNIIPLLPASPNRNERAGVAPPLKIRGGWEGLYHNSPYPSYLKRGDKSPILLNFLLWISNLF